MQKLISLILTIICSTILFAQTAPQVKPGTHGAQEEYRIENSKINYSPVIEGESIITKISYVWTETINGSSKQLATTSTLSYTIPKVGSDQGTLVDISVRVTEYPQINFTRIWIQRFIILFMCLSSQL